MSLKELAEKADTCLPWPGDYLAAVDPISILCLIDAIPEDPRWLDESCYSCHKDATRLQGHHDWCRWVAARKIAGLPL